jgi:hypothetical protein
MDSWFENLYSKNKILFWFLLIVGFPFVVLFLFRDLILKIIVAKSNEELAKSKIDDVNLSEKERVAKDSSELSKQNADTIEKEIGSIREDEDWNKKRGEVTDLSLLIVIFVLDIAYCVSRSFF